MINKKIEQEFINNVIEDHRQMQLALYDAQQMIKTFIANQILVRELHYEYLYECMACNKPYPCATIKALEGNRNG